MHRVRRPLAVTVLIALVGALGFVVSGAGSAAAAPNTSAYALVSSGPNGSLVPLTITPGAAPAAPTVVAGTSVPVTGLVAGQTLVGIDFRPAKGTLVGVGVNAGTGSASVYTIAPATGVATPAGSPVTLATGVVSWGVDFNPTVDRIRLVGANGANYRLHPDTGALAFTDGSLAFLAGDANAGDTPLVASAAYTNDFGDPATATAGTAAKATTLYGLDAGNDVLVAVEPPNDGKLRTIGPLGADVPTDADFDITTNGIAYAVVGTSSDEVLRTVNLATGALGTASAPLGIGTVVGFAVETGATPVVAGNDGYAVTEGGSLLAFELDNPAGATTVAPITGLPTGFLVAGIDTRPLDGSLWAVAINAGSGLAQLATIDRGTAKATPFGAQFAVTPAAEYGFDFNPTVDRIRFVTSAGQNLRFNPNNAAAPLVSPADGNLSYPAQPSQVPNLTSTAYTNSFSGAAGTLHLGIDTADNLVYFTNSNAGSLRTVAPVSLGGTTVDVAGDTALDVAADGRVFFAGVVGGATKLFTINPVTGALTASGASNTIGGGATLRAFAISGNYVAGSLATSLDVRPPISLRGRIVVNLGEVQATLTTAAGDPVVGAIVTFKAGRTVLCTDDTDATGSASCVLGVTGLLRLLLNGGYSAQYAGSGNLQAASGSTGLIG